MKDRRASQALFQSISSDGTDWLFVVGCDSGWAIKRNGMEVHLGYGDRSSVIRGVQKFLLLTRVPVGSDAVCDRTFSAPASLIPCGPPDRAVQSHCLITG